MGFADMALEDVRPVWGRRPCDIHLILHPPGTIECFNVHASRSATNG